MSDPFTSGSNKTNAASAANGLALTVPHPMPQPLILLKPLPFEKKKPKPREPKIHPFSVSVFYLKDEPKPISNGVHRETQEA
ncbi:hypothetical protein PanWU01x14_117750 [Parasponia andersonii]|uniref:Uncharacterized protein n=1 Tax=Parasponia andersonii TaxID=3476 RepID=A0A2P5CW31_PARAD|nr:hypothetical protein PanWU01x14_117750 [Parasponia andersonii]